VRQPEDFRIACGSAERRHDRLEKLRAARELDGRLRDAGDRERPGGVDRHRGDGRVDDVLDHVDPGRDVDRGSWEDAGIEEVEEDAHVRHEIDLASEAARNRARGKHSSELGGPGFDEADRDEPAHRGSGGVDASRRAEFRGEEPEELVRALRPILQDPAVLGEARRL